MTQHQDDSEAERSGERGVEPRRVESLGAWLARALPGGPGSAARGRRAARADLRGGHGFLAELTAAASARRGPAREGALRRLGQRLTAALELLEARSTANGTPAESARALARSLGPRGFLPDDLQRARAAALEESTLAIPASPSELERRALDATGRPGRAWVRAAGVDRPRAFARADALDTARRLAEWADRLLLEAEAGRLRLPLADLDRSPLTVADLLEPGVRDHPALAALLSARVGRVRGLLANARDANEDLPRPERWILRAHAARTEQLCRRLETRGFKPLRPRRLR